MATWGWRDDRGQATAEHLGMVMVVALLMGAMALWVASGVNAPSHPPDVLARITAPLDTGRTVADGVPHIRMPASRQGPGLFHRAWEGFLTWGVLNVDGEVQAGRGFLEEMKGQAERLATDPVGSAVRVFAALRGVPSLSIPSDPPTPDPATVGEDPIDQLGLWGYLWDAPKRPWRETAMGLSRIAGRRAADWVLTRWFKWLGGRMAAARAAAP